MACFFVVHKSFYCDFIVTAQQPTSTVQSPTTLSRFKMDYAGISNKAALACKKTTAPNQILWYYPIYLLFVTCLVRPELVQKTLTNVSPYVYCNFVYTPLVKSPHSSYTVLHVYTIESLLKHKRQAPCKHGEQYSCRTWNIKRRILEQYS